MIAGQANRLHHRLGARHVKGYFVQARDFAETLDIVDDCRVIGAEHRSEVSHAFRPLCDAILVKVLAEKIDPYDPVRS